jgi:amidophosphoribosyltransferase
MASKVFNDGDRIADLSGFMGIGHLRYPTAGTSSASEAQPFFVNSPYGLAFSHNGNLVNAPELREYLDKQAHRHINTDSDSEVMLNIFAAELNETGKARVNSDDCFAALERTYKRCRGAWAATALIAGLGILAFRDSHAIRPLLLGSRTLEIEKINAQGEKTVDITTDYMIASESVALSYFGCKTADIMDIKAGQAVLIEKGQKPKFHQVVPESQCRSAVDIFEHVYLSRPDSEIDGISVYAARRNMGHKLADHITRVLSEQELKDIDVVIPIPETAMVSARTCAGKLKKQFVEGFVKNRYIFRTFIMPNQLLRRTGVRKKLNAIESEFRGKTVLLVDDSIVRGTTSKEIVQMAREAGAKKVIFASCAPQITHPHIYGIDLASASELIAYNKTDEQIATAIGADSVIFQTLPDLEAACAEASPLYPKRKVQFETGVFSGKYVTGIEDGYIEHLEELRGSRKRAKKALEARHNLANGRVDGEDLKLLAQENGVSPVVVNGLPCVVQGRLRQEQGEDREESNGKNGQASGGSGFSQDPSVHNQFDHFPR